MEKFRLLDRGWIAPVVVGLVGIAISWSAFWLAQRADERRVRSVIELRAEWRARDLEAKLRLSGNAVENIAIATAANTALDPDQFNRIARRAREGLDHVNALQWAPRVRKAELAAFEAMARSYGIAEYRVFDVTPDFQPTALADRDEYFPVLFDARGSETRRTHGLALGRYDGRRIPMQMSRDEGQPIATSPVRSIGPQSPELVYLLFWPVYDGIEAPPTIEERRKKLRGFAVGNFNVPALLTAALRDTPAIVETIHFSIAATYDGRAAPRTAVIYTPGSHRVLPEPLRDGLVKSSAVRTDREFTVFGQHWTLTFDYSEAAVARLRSQGAWGWLLSGLLLTASLVFYLLRERGRTQAIEALVTERTAELERTTGQLHQAQKMEAIGTLTGGMAHDFNNLLSIVIGNLDLLQDQIKNDPEAAALAESALQAGLRGADLTRQLLAFARRQTLEPKLTDVNELVGGMTRLLKRILEADIEIVLLTAPDLWRVTIDPAQLNAAITNLATNARDAMPKGGRLTIETKNTHLDADYAAHNREVTPGNFVLIEVSDTGTGISPEALPQVFEPFFTTKESGQGTGLGLSMVYGFVKQSQGHIKIYSEVGQGTTVRLYLPRAGREAQAPQSTTDTVVEIRIEDKRILVVEDNADVRHVVTKQLADLGYTIYESENAQAALAILKNPEVEIDLLFTDIVMPGRMSGHDLARAAIADRPALKILFTSGYSGSALRHDDRLKEGEHFLSKPYRRADLARKIQEVFKQ
jgi:signal transduction histidine kinase/ActR/RegA family two-component response regulator